MNIFINETGDNARCSIGILIITNVQNIPSRNKLLPVRQHLETAIRSTYSQTKRAELKAIRPMDTYVAYYKKFGYTYHVLPQLESIIKGKTIPSGLPLVEAMFMAELKNSLLTACHDLDKIKIPLRLKISTGKENFTALNGKNVATIPEDFMITDQEAVISSILRGPDLRTAITEHTKRVVYMVYAPIGVEKLLVHKHLRDIETYVHLVSEKAVTSLSQVFDKNE